MEGSRWKKARRYARSTEGARAEREGLFKPIKPLVALAPSTWAQSSELKTLCAPGFPNLPTCVRAGVLLSSGPSSGIFPFPLTKLPLVLPFQTSFEVERFFVFCFFN